MDDIRIPSRELCEEILIREAGNYPRILSHSRLVARVAERLGEAANRQGMVMNTQLLWAAGCLHDIAKGRRRHAEEAAALLREQGWPAVAELVEVHMDVPLSGERELTAAEILYLADKLTEGDKVVGLLRRFAAVAERYPDDLQAQRNITERLKKAETIQRKLEKLAGQPVAALISGLDTADPR